MKTQNIVFPLAVILILITACSPGEPETVLPPVEPPVTEAAPTSAPEADEPLPTVAPPVEEAPGLTDEQTVLSAFFQPVTATGEVLVFYGHVLDASGAPLSGYAVEIWQVDANGSYDHPNDPSTQNRDRNFQFYGTSLTDENGLYSFRTLIPARYEPRPRHIHFKLKKDGQEVMTSQFYFAEDVDAAQFGASGEMLLLTLADAQDGAGNAVKVTSKDIVIDAGSGGTPLQMEGPYYPVVDVSGFDNDLASVK